MNPDLPYLIALSKITHIGPITAKTLISYCGSAEEVFRTGPKTLNKIPRIGKAAIDLLGTVDPEKLYEPELSFIEKKALKVLSYKDSGYPIRLKNQMESPIILYYKGTADLNAKRMLAVVGTRKASPYGLSQCQKIIEGLSEYQVTIVSGLAYGIDACAHKHSLKNDLPTIAVMGTSFDTLYPASHKNLAARILDDGGILSELPSGSRRDKEHFPMRNRLIAGMTDGLLVVESKPKGGSMISVTFAKSYNKEIFAIPGRINDVYSAGCNHLIKTNQAFLITQAEDICYHLNWERKNQNNNSKQIDLFEPLVPLEQEIVDLINQNPNIHIDKLNLLLKSPPGEVASHLLQLEFKGLVKSLPGKRYMTM